jgi:hypothetical protein
MTREETIRELELERAEALGFLLGMVDCVILAQDIPGFFKVGEKIDLLKMRREAFDKADKAYLAARLA